MPNDLFPPLNGFQSRKAAQMAAYFAQLAGGKIERLKLIKLLYLSERHFMADHDRPMLYDELYSLKDGPICSACLNGINGIIDVEIWSECISRNGNWIFPIRTFGREDLDDVSDAELAAVDAVWMRLGHMTASQIRNYSHDNCPEYTTVFSGRSPITYAEVFHALGSREPATLAAGVEEFRQFDSSLAKR